MLGNRDQHQLGARDEFAAQADVALADREAKDAHHRSPKQVQLLNIPWYQAAWTQAYLEQLPAG